MPQAITQVLTHGVEALQAVGVDNPRLDARLLLASAMTVPHTEILFSADKEVDDKQLQLFQSYLSRRSAFEPVSRILGEREFWSLPFAVTPDTLDPRPESETIVETVLEKLVQRKQSKPLILDAGTGTGCLLLALLTELQNAFGIGVDLSPGAAGVALQNAKRLGLESRSLFVVGDWLSGLVGEFDVIISNPPYISNQEITRLAPDVRKYDPRLALAGGQDGLEAYRALIPESCRLLSPEGFMVLEIGQGQESDVAAILSDNGLRRVELHADLAGIIRCISATKN